MDIKNGCELTAKCPASTIRNDVEEINRTETFQKDDTDRKAAGIKQQLSYDFLANTNRHKEMRPLLDDFISAVQHQTGCKAAAVQVLNIHGKVSHTACGGFHPDGDRVEKTLSSEIDRNIYQQVLHNSADTNLPSFTQYGSYVINCRSLSSGDDRNGEIDASKDSSPSGCKKLALIPIRFGDQTIGMVHIRGGFGDNLNIETIKILETASVQLGIAIQRILADEALKAAYLKLEERIRERTQELSNANESLRNQIEERRRAEERLQKSYNMLQTVIDGLKDSLILVDQNMHIRMLNRVATDYYGLESSEKAAGLVCSEASGLVGECEHCKIPQAVLRGAPMTFERQCPMDPDRIEEVSIYPVAGECKQHSDAIIRITDITEHKRFERQLIQSEKMASLGVLVSSIAHEINNPNNFIFFNIPIMREYLMELVHIADEYAEKHPGLELFHMSYDEFRRDVFKLVDNIEHGSKRISSFVANLREFSLENGNRSKEWLDLHSVVEKVVTICRSQIKKRVKTFEVNIPEGLPPIYADVYSIEQILLNLLINAVQAADKKESRITLTATGRKSWQDHTTIIVSDNGSGMDKKTVKKIFDPFFTTKTAADGTGLGLYVSHNLIQGLGGRIEVESEPGKGSTFTVILPDKDRRRVTRA